MSERVLERPPRPAIPAVLWGLVATIVSERVVLDASRSLPAQGLRTTALVLAGLGGVLALVVVAMARISSSEESDAEVDSEQGASRQLMHTCLVILTCACIGASTAAATAARQVDAFGALATSSVSSWKLRVVSDPSESAYGFRCTARAEVDGAPTALVTVSANESFERGQVISCVGRFSPLSSDDYGRSAWRRGVVGSVRVVRVRTVGQTGGMTSFFLRFRARALAIIEPERSESRALLAGIACGDRSALDQCGLGDLFSACGLAHVVAVSGAHLAIVAALLGTLLLRTSMKPKARLVVLALATGSFVLLCGAPPSAVRAWFMTLVANAGQLIGRRGHGLSSVGVVALAMALVNPHLVGQLGFLLSITSIVVLTVYGRYVTYVLGVLVGSLRLPGWMPSPARKRTYGAIDGCRGMLAATFVCQVGTLPLTVASFGNVSLVAPLANVVVGPALATMLAMGVVIVCLQAVPWLCAPILLAFDLLCAPILAVLDALSRCPLAVMSLHVSSVVLTVAVVLVGALVYAWWPRPSRTLLLRILSVGATIVLVCLVQWRFAAPARVVVLDIGQGDAILVQDGASAVLVDTGPDDSVVAALARKHVLHLDAVVLTHLHDDHYGGMASLAQRIDCDQVLVAEGVVEHMDDELLASCTRLTGQAPEELQYGDELSFGSYRLRMVWPREIVEGTENCDSIELLVTYQRGKMSLTALLTGDAEENETAACIQAGDVGGIDLLKVGHHGSEVSVNPQIAAALHPLVAVASAGEGNDYGHPRQECIEMLEAVGARFLCTKDVGDVEIRPGAKGPLIRCQRKGFRRDSTDQD